ncbi:hypothetical protein TNCV_3173281 [Trichonephila clavipes]|nr:hypothetical protein TNCV_3173281 [Trichonephila clavipes]
MKERAVSWTLPPPLCSPLTLSRPQHLEKLEVARTLEESTHPCSNVRKSIYRLARKQNRFLNSILTTGKLERISWVYAHHPFSINESNVIVWHPHSSRNSAGDYFHGRNRLLILLSFPGK